MKGFEEDVRTPRKKSKGTPAFVAHHQVAIDHSVSNRTVMRWIERAEFPLPHTIRGTIRYWRRGDYEHYIKTGRWPAGAEFRAKH